MSRRIIAYKIFGRFYHPDDVTIITEGNEMSDINMIRMFREIVHDYALTHLDVTDGVDANKFAMADVYVVWSCKTLQNWKALISTNLLDGMYYELTYDGDKGMIYLDVYKKFENRAIPTPEFEGYLTRAAREGT